jgi:hypothetical protein
VRVGRESPTVISATGRVSAEERAKPVRYHCTIIRDGKKRLNWPVLGPLVLANFVVVVGGSELGWHALTGGFSTLVGLYALVAASIAAVRIIGTSLAKPFDLLKAEAGGV